MPKKACNSVAKRSPLGKNQHELEQSVSSQTGQSNKYTQCNFIMGAGASAMADSTSDVSLFLGQTAKRNPNDITSEEWLFNACWFNNIAIANALLERGHPDLRWSHPEHPKLRGRTCMHAAAFAGHIGVVELLLKHDPSVAEYEDEEGYLPIDYAREGNHDEIVDMLERL